MHAIVAILLATAASVASAAPVVLTVQGRVTGVADPAISFGVAVGDRIRVRAT